MQWGRFRSLYVDQRGKTLAPTLEVRISRRFSYWIEGFFNWKLDTFGLRNPDDVILLQALLEMESIL